MAVEVILIQKYTRFIGPGSYSFVTILFTLLLASGIGSRFSERFKAKTAFGGILIWILLDVFILEHLLRIVDFAPLLIRILIAVLIVFPLGFFMGMPFPKGTKLVGDLIDWGFAVNGAASVLGSTAIMLVAFNYGYNMALIAGGLAYLLAMLIIRSPKNWVKS